MTSTLTVTAVPTAVAFPDSLGSLQPVVVIPGELGDAVAPADIEGALDERVFSNQFYSAVWSQPERQ